MNLFFCSQLGKCSDQPGSALWLWWTASGGPCYISARMKSMRNPAVIVGMITLQKKSWSHRSCLGSSKDVRIYIVYVYIYTLNIYYVYIYYIIYILVLIVGVINVKLSLVYINPPISTVNVNFVTLVMWVISKTPKKSGFPLCVFF